MITLFLFFAFLFSTVCAQDVSVHAQSYAKVNLTIGIVGEQNDMLKQIATQLNKNITWSGQFDVQVVPFGEQLSKKRITQLFKENTPLAVFLSVTDKDTIEWRVYDTMRAQMVAGKKYKKRGELVRGWAHNIADNVWPVLTGQQGFFSTKIAFAQTTKGPKGKSIKHIYVADYDGSNKELLVDTPTVNVAPRWNADKNNPLLFYSEYTNTNIRLMVSDTKKRRKAVTNADGVTMLPAFTRDGKKVVYCSSRGDGNCQLYFYKKGKLRRVAFKDKKTGKSLLDGNNISPTISADGKTIYFCSDFQTGRPQIYVYHIRKRKLERLTQGGYCASPSYCEKRNALAYAKIVGGTMQLFVYDLGKKTHTQITKDAGNKEECSWSPCGNYLVFSVEHRDKSRIAMRNLLTKKRIYLTARSDYCCYPAWSSYYAKFPAVSRRQIMS